jgi:hypothetical protein
VSSILRQHIDECMREAGVDPECRTCEQSHGEGLESWYEETSGSPWAWRAFLNGWGTSSGLSREDAIARVMIRAEGGAK